MAQLTYPSKPWKDKQVSELVPGLKFFYSSSLQKWIPLSPVEILDDTGTTSTVSDESIVDLQKQINAIVISTANNGKILKLNKPPANPKDNDVFHHLDKGVFYSYNNLAGTWVQVL